MIRHFSSLICIFGCHPNNRGWKLRITFLNTQRGLHLWVIKFMNNRNDLPIKENQLGDDIYYPSNLPDSCDVRYSKK